jgi:hypothetical protein
MYLNTGYGWGVLFPSVLQLVERRDDGKAGIRDVTLNLSLGVQRPCLLNNAEKTLTLVIGCKD